MNEKKFYVYLLAKRKYSTYYIGMTSNLQRRIWEHREGVIEGFTKKNNIKMLVYYEVFDDAENAIRREKRFKKWPRAWKEKVTNEMNPEWKDLYETLN